MWEECGWSGQRKILNSAAAAAWNIATRFFIWTTLKRTVHSSTQVLSTTPKQKLMVLLLGSAALLVSSKPSAAPVQ